MDEETSCLPLPRPAGREMEEGEQREESKPQQPPTTTTATTLHPKHAAMLERLSARHSSSHRTTNSNTTASFLDAFSASKRSIESALLNPLSPSDGPDRIRSHLSHLSSQISDLDALLSENSHLLSPYDLRQSLSSISDLRSSLHSLSSSLLPRQRFSFRNRPSPKPPSVTPPTSIPPPTAVAPPRDYPGFRGRERSTLVKDFRASRGQEGEFTLEDLSSCEVYLKGHVRALFVHRVRDCRVLVGPVTGSVLVEGAEGCVFVVAAHQIRIHSARGTDFYLRVRSRPIVEDCEGLRFGPYRLAYDGLEGDLEEARLREDTGNWANVDDFRWLRAVQSPNWRVLGEEEREGVVDISGFDETAG